MITIQIRHTVAKRACRIRGGDWQSQPHLHHHSEKASLNMEAKRFARRGMQPGSRVRLLKQLEVSAVSLTAWGRGFELSEQSTVMRLGQRLLSDSGWRRDRNSIRWQEDCIQSGRRSSSTDSRPIRLEVLVQGKTTALHCSQGASISSWSMPLRVSQAEASS